MVSIPSAEVLSSMFSTVWSMLLFLDFSISSDPAHFRYSKKTGFRDLETAQSPDFIKPISYHKKRQDEILELAFLSISPAIQKGSLTFFVVFWNPRIRAF